MACFHPVWARLPPVGAYDRRFKFLPARQGEEEGTALQVACGQCLGCRLDWSRQWKLRGMLELQAQPHGAENWFVTATYSNEALPPDRSVCLRDVQLWLKRMRHEGARFSYMIAAEYSPAPAVRPHYHGIFFDLRLDRSTFIPWGSGKNGEALFRAPGLEASWGRGFVVVGAVAPQSIGYVVDYSVKKVMGREADAEYGRTAIDEMTGALRHWKVLPPFFISSRRPSIGRRWFDRFWRDAFPSEKIVLDGVVYTPPDYFYSLLSKQDPAMFELVCEARLDRALEFARSEESSPERLATKAESRELKAGRLIRSGGSEEGA